MFFNALKYNKNLNWVPSKEEQLQFSKISHPKIYNNTQDLFYEGHIPYGVHIVFEGKIQIIQFYEKNSNLRKIECFDAPIVLGVYPILNHSLYDHTVKCFKNSIIAFIEKREFLKYCKLYI